MLDTRWLLTLIRVAEEGSLAGAARRLGYTASAVSQQISSLERAAGVPLIERSAQSIRLTPTAHALVERARGILASLHALDSELAALASGLMSVLRVGTFPSAGSLALPRVLSGLRAELPTASVTLDEGEPDELVARVDDGSLDAALVYRYGLEPLHLPEGLTARTLMTERLFLIAKSGTLGSARELSIAMLADQPWISARDGSPGSRTLSRIFAMAGIAPIVPVRSNNHAMVRSLVSSGEGVSVIPELGLPASFTGDVRRLTGEGAFREVLLVTRSSDTSHAVSTFSHVAAAAFAGLHQPFGDVLTCAVADQ